MRFAAPGAQINIHCLHDQSDGASLVAKVYKTKSSYVQAPGCKLPITNGFRLSNFILDPIGAHELNGDWLDGWEEARAVIKSETSNKKDTY